MDIFDKENWTNDGQKVVLVVSVSEFCIYKKQFIHIFSTKNK